MGHGYGPSIETHQGIEFTLYTKKFKSLLTSNEN